MKPGYDIQTPLDLLNEGNADEAVPLLEFLVARMPSHVTAHVLLAQAYSQDERWQEALSAWQNALFLMPNSPAIRKGLRQVLRILSRHPAQRVASPRKVTPISRDSQPVSEDSDAPKPPEEATPVIDDEADNAVPLATDAGADIEEVSVSTEEEEQKTEPASIPSLSVNAPGVRTAPSGPAKRPVVSPFVPPALASFVQSEAGIGEDEELDDLIQELESARIVPNPDHETSDTVQDADIGDMVSETLARIYEGQKKYDEAAAMYEKLADQQPENADDFLEKAATLRTRTAGKSD